MSRHDPLDPARPPLTHANCRTKLPVPGDRLGQRTGPGPRTHSRPRPWRIGGGWAFSGGSCGETHRQTGGGSADGRWCCRPGAGRRPCGPPDHQPGLRQSLGQSQPPRERLGCGCLPGPPSGGMSSRTGGKRPLRRTLCWERLEEMRPAAVPGWGRGILGHRRLKEKADWEAKNTTAPGFPRWSPIQVLNRPDPA